MSSPQKIPILGWNGWVGRLIDGYGRQQKWWWAGLVAFLLAWVSFDIGQLVARADILSGAQNVKGTISIAEAVEKSDKGDGGRLIILSTTSARFVDVSGVSWEIPDFAKTASQGDMDKMKANGVVFDGSFNLSVRPVKTKPSDLLFATLSDLVIKLMFFGFYAFILYFIIRHFKNSSGHRFKKITNEHTSVKINDVAGYDGVKQELLEVVDYLRNPERFERLGARPPKGVLLYGPPGTGKTLLAKAVAGEAAASFFEQSASSFVQVYAGEGAKAVRKLFEEARKSLPAVIFIDEIDAVGASRSGASHDERVQDRKSVV